LNDSEVIYKKRTLILPKTNLHKCYFTLGEK